MSEAKVARTRHKRSDASSGLGRPECDESRVVMLCSNDVSSIVDTD